MALMSNRNFKTLEFQRLFSCIFYSKTSLVSQRSHPLCTNTVRKAALLLAAEISFLGAQLQRASEASILHLSHTTCCVHLQSSFCLLPGLLSAASEMN